jgi:hypothetical protein
MGAIMRSDNMNLREFENEVCVIWKKNLFKKWFFFFFFFRVEIIGQNYARCD